jgi:hypothetical protein
VVGEVPFRVSGGLFSYALVVAEEVAGGSAVVNLVELVDVVGEFTI